MEKKYKKVETIQMPKVDEILDNFTPSPEQQQRAQFVDWIVLDKLAPDQLFTKVWNTHVVPLEQKISDLMIENTRVSEGDRYRQDYFKRVTSGLESENKALRDQIVGLKNICDMDRKTEYQYTQLLKEKEALRDEVSTLKNEIERLKINQPPFR